MLLEPAIEAWVMTLPPTKRNAILALYFLFTTFYDKHSIQQQTESDCRDGCFPRDWPKGQTPLEPQRRYEPLQSYNNRT